jgi:hypothetical protein
MGNLPDELRNEWLDEWMDDDDESHGMHAPLLM